MAISPADVKSFIDEKWSPQNCPRCGVVDWQLGEWEHFKGLIPLGDDGANVYGTAFMPAYWVLCGNCGHLEWIAAKIVRAWLKERDNG